MKSTPFGMELFEDFTLPVHFNIRLCVKEDLRNLEWFGLFTKHRQIIRGAFRRQERGQNLMLLAETNCFPIGQAWIDLARRRPLSIGVFWAVRVFPYFQNAGIATRLLRRGEQLLLDRGFTGAELGVEKKDSDARRLYERLGYRLVGAVQEQYSYTAPDGKTHHVPSDEWILRKELAGPGDDGIKNAREPALRVSQTKRKNVSRNKHQHWGPVDHRRR